MKIIIYLILSLAVLISGIVLDQAYGQTLEQGSDYDKVTIDKPDGSKTVLWSSSPPRIFDGSSWKPYILQEDANIIQVESAQGSFVFDKNSCALSFFGVGSIAPGDTPVIASDSYIARQAVDGSDSWNDITQINNAVCQTSVIQSGNDIEIHVTKESQNIGQMIIKYIKKEGQQLKTQIEVTNWTNLNDRQFGFIQTLQIPNSISFNGNQIDISNFNDTEFNRQWLVDNKAKLIRLSDKVAFDFDLGFENLWSIRALYIDGKAMLALDYSNNAPVILPGQTLIIDPTVETFTDTWHNVETISAAGAACPAVNTKSAFRQLRVLDNLESGITACYVAAPEYNITSLPDGLQIDEIILEFDVSASVSPRNCDVWSIEFRPTTQTASSLWTDISNGTEFIDNDGTCGLLGLNNLTLPASANTDLENNLVSNWWAFGLLYNTMSRDGADHQITYDGIKIYVTGSVGPITDLNCNFDNNPSDYSVNCDWSSTAADSYRIQRNNGSGWFVLVNDTQNTNLFYNDTALANALWHAYNVTGWSNDGESPGSNIENVTTIDPVSMSPTVPGLVGGNVFGPNITSTGFRGFPNFTINQAQLFINGTLNHTEPLSISVTNPPQNFSIFNFTYFEFEFPLNASANIRVENFTGDTLNFIGANFSHSINYLPNYFTSAQGGHSVNYTLTRFFDQPTTDTLNLRVNRQPINFQIECLYQTNSEAAFGNRNNPTGTWINFTDVGFYNQNRTIPASTNQYISCYNDDLLFTTTSFANRSLAVFGISSFDSVFGNFLGVPTGVFFLMLLAGMANQRNAHIYTIVLLGATAIMVTIGFFSLDAAVWGLTLVVGAVGLIVGRKLF